MSNFLDIVMEAKGKKSLKIKAETEPEDYTQGDEEGEESEPETDDILDEEEETETSDDNGDDIGDDEDLEPTDYTEEEEEFSDEDDTVETEDDGEPSNEDDTIPDEDEPTDYTEDETGSDDTTGDEDTDGEDGTDYTSDDGGESDMGSEEEMSEGEEGPSSEDRKNKGLLDDLIKLKGIVHNFIDKLSSVNMDNTNKVKFVGQINSNLTQLSEQIHNYIVYRFQHESYIRNLYFYNHSVEAVNVNINMLKKISKMNDNK